MELVKEDSNTAASYMLLNEHDKGMIRSLDITQLREQLKAIDKQEKSEDERVYPC
jgi:hypothetical protein